MSYRIIERIQHAADMLEASEMGTMTALDCRAAAEIANDLIEATAEEFAAADAYSSARTGTPRNIAWDALRAARTRRLSVFARITAGTL